jgi:hypothetical protein
VRFAGLEEEDEGDTWDDEDESEGAHEH